jgi:hypothetical protein
MNSIDPTNENIRNVLNLARDNLSFLAKYTLLGLLIGFLYSFSLEPKFSVTATVSGNESMSSPSSAMDSSLGNFLGLEGQSSMLNDFFNVLFSYKTAEKMWDKGYNKVFFSSQYDPEKDLYNRSSFPLSQVLKSKILGYELNKNIGPQNLKEIFVSSIIYTKEEGGAFLISSLTSRPALYQRLLNDLIQEADDLLKQEKLASVQNQISYLNLNLSKGSFPDRDISDALIDSLKNKHLEISLLSNDLPYSVKVIEAPLISQNPVSPNLFLHYFLFGFLGFSLSFLFKFIKRLFNNN